MSSKNLIFTLLNTALLLEALVYGLIAPLMPYYSKELNVGPGQLGIIFAAYSLALLAASFPAGAACDRLGRRRVLLAGMLVLFASTLLFAWASNLWLLILSRIFQGAAGAAIWTAALAAAAVMFPPQERGRRLGLMMAITGVGTIAGPIFSGFVFSYWGYQAPFFSAALLILPVGLALMWLPLPEPTQVQREAHTDITGFIKALGDAKLALVILLVMAGSFSFGMLEPLLPLHLAKEFNLESRGIGIVFGVLSLAHSGIQPLWGYLTDRIGYHPVILMGLVSAALTMPALALAPQLPHLYIAGCLYGFASSAVLTPCLPLLAAYSDEKDGETYGQNFGLVNAAFSVGLLLGPAVGGLIAQYFSFLAATLLYSAMILALGAGIYRQSLIRR